jgi:hypothetical protein
MKLNEQEEKKLQKLIISIIEFKLEFKNRLKHQGIDLDNGDKNSIYNRINEAHRKLIRATQQNNYKI